MNDNDTPTPKRQPTTSWTPVIIVGSVGLAFALLSACCIVPLLIGTWAAPPDNGRCPICGHEQHVPILGGIGNHFHETRCRNCGQSYTDIVWHIRYDDAHSPTKDRKKRF